MKRLKRSFWAKAAVAVASIAIAIGVIGGISFASNNQPFLGDCIEYGIVCNYLNQTADMETNFAVGKYQGNGHWNGNTISESKANASGEIRIGEVVGESKFRGTPYVVVKESVKDEVKAMLTSVSNYAESVVKKADYTTPKDVKDMNNYHVDITGIDEEVVYVDADAMVENITAGKIQNGGIKVTLRANQSLVFNVSLKDTVRIPEYKITVKNGSKTHEEMAESVVWNMPYVTNLNLNSDGMRATIIAPKAFVNLGTTSEGWLVCDTVVSNSGEWHMISKKVPKVTPTPKVTATPTPKVTATPTPNVTATPTPKVTATPTPKVTATPTPKVTATPTPKVTATPTPKVTATPTPKVTATPTPKVTATPTPKVTATPTPKVTATPTPKVTATPTPKVTATPTPKVTATPTPKVTATPTPKVTATPTPTPTATPTATPEVTPTTTPEVTPTATPEVTPTATPGDDATPTPEVTAIATPNLFDFDEDTPRASKELTDPDTPKASATSKKTTTLLDEDVPLSDSAPETGDTTNLLFPMIVMGLSVLAIFGVIVFRKKMN